MVDEMLNQDNYFTWKFKSRMKLMKKGLLDHIDGVNALYDENVALWKVNDSTAFAIVASSITQTFNQWCEEQIRPPKCGKY
uniref:AlNc14C45G3685 protein n=1 Tax=Albugo laibachii Nc14 TaxID=890382 RepID=F0WAF8_9STRA|nr:AlNc14C45G3685 [Albugo laibachii Nc14]|eukprot:CCA18129.1 AlNc14C45G3685 [Albugo laibachii Nc14]